MNPDDILHGYGEKAIGIAVAHILFIGEGELLDIFQALDIVRSYSRLVKGLFVEGDIGINPGQGTLQAF